MESRSQVYINFKKTVGSEMVSGFNEVSLRPGMTNQKKC